MLVRLVYSLVVAGQAVLVMDYCWLVLFSQWLLLASLFCHRLLLISLV